MRTPPPSRRPKVAAVRDDPEGRLALANEREAAETTARGRQGRAIQQSIILNYLSI